MPNTISWGILGTAGIALNKVIPGMLQGTRGRILGIASRDEARAREAAARFGIPRSYGSYEAMLEDDAIDAVYIPLPNQLHVPWAVKAMEAGKHVLCEKPIALDAAEAATLVAARDRTGRQVLEAFMVRQHPQWLKVRDLVGSGRIGEVRLVQTTLSYFNVDAGNVRNRVETGGGALYDIGCYAVLLARFVFGAEPVRAVAAIERDPAFGTDRLTTGIVDFGRDRHLAFSCSTQLVRFQRTQILGTQGRIEVPVSLNAPQGEATRIMVDATGAIDDSGVSVEALEPCDQYTLQGDLAAQVFLGEIEAPYPIEDAVLNMRVVDALYRSGRSGAWESV
ncbi:MAG TPA: Gfo/Idh/MocA family oxidoreductase [Microvirga sp.]|jgi:predicted dehydrogenase|nr:Gfo/Idh/MocA family oxidoreductase [Microvirga sp.]